MATPRGREATTVLYRAFKRGNDNTKGTFDVRKFSLFLIFVDGFNPERANDSLIIHMINKLGRTFLISTL